MPIYGYVCKACGHAFDALQKMSDPVLVECPECNEAALRKQLSAPKFRLKGGGWYETDFKTGDKRNIAGEAEKKADSGTDKASTDAPKAAEKTQSTTETKKPSSDSSAKSA